MADEKQHDESEDIKIEELDDKDLEEATGGLVANNEGCNCGCPSA